MMWSFLPDHLSTTLFLRGIVLVPLPKKNVMSTKKNLLKTALMHNDIEDSGRDKKRLEPDEAIIDIPDAEEIPGQEHIHVPPLGELADTTISSDDEEGKGLFKDDIINDDFTVTEEEKDLLARTENSLSEEDDEDRRKAQLDDSDLDGDLLNENDDISGRDLDVPGAEEDDAD